MFGLFKSKPFVDDALGAFIKKGNYWIGSIELSPHGVMELRLIGDRKAPDASILLLARELPSRYVSFIHQIETALYDDFLPYAQANARGELGELEEPLPEIADAKQIWPHVHPLHVSIEPMQGVPTVEVAYRVGWDEEHTLGARLQNWSFLELCGSV
jgi:hypothetical protein